MPSVRLCPVIQADPALPGLGYELNNEMLSSLPSLVTIAAMALFAHAVRQPEALARPFIRGLK